ncbi:hypothetical protein Acr_00g0007600 [Actinidia rufa]|uniref:Uncharacterized protein n=1 Tax=Actinidia rufa TaxID=165716 RepID=A0A7J0D8D0_9ERIC|nr:hypothetical protein Acr_00g0007600 [Actinidia rufa]
MKSCPVHIMHNSNLLVFLCKIHPTAIDANGVLPGLQFLFYVTTENITTRKATSSLQLIPLDPSSYSQLIPLDPSSYSRTQTSFASLHQLCQLQIPESAAHCHLSSFLVWMDSNLFLSVSSSRMCHLCDYSLHGLEMVGTLEGTIAIASVYQASGITGHQNIQV